MADGDRWFFERIARVYDLAMPAADPAALAAGLDRAARPIERVLDVGGGTGRAVRAVDAPERIVLDASRGMLRGAPDGLARVQGSATALPVRAGTIDAVLIVDALHHLPDVDAVLREAGRVLRPGGIVVVRDFDPGTARGWLLARGERLLRLRSTFRGPDAVAELLDGAGLDQSVVERGFGYTVSGRKPGHQ